MENVLTNLKVRWFDIEMQSRALAQARAEVEQEIIAEQQRLSTLPTNKSIEAE